MSLDRHLSRAVILGLAAAVFTASCNKKDSSGSTTSPSCSFSVVQPTTTFGPEGGTGSASVTVSAGTGCTWTATSSASFITFTTGSGTGSGTAAFTVAVNTGAERTSTLTIAGSSVTITQRAAAVTPPATLAAPTLKSPSGGQEVETRPTLVINNAVSTGNIGTVTYRFEVSELDTFPNDSRTLTQDGIAQGSGTTSWPVSHDLAPGRQFFWRARATNGTITTAFSTVETFKTGGCSYTLSSTSVSVGASGGSGTVNITTTSVCNWAAISNDGFIVLTSPSSGSGNGSIAFNVLANTTGAARTGTLTVAGQTVTVSQPAAGGSAPGLSISFQLFDPAAQGGATTECRFRDQSGSNPTTCTLRSTSFATGTNSIVSQSWTVDYTYNAPTSITGTGSTVSFTDTCGKATSTDDGTSQPLSVTLTVTDSNGVTGTATSGVGTQPALFVRLFTCGK